MKVLGISFGRKDQHCDMAVKSALLGAQEKGADIAFINTTNLNIDRCTMCFACGILKEKGKDPVCTIKDDFPFLEREIMEADGLILAAPVYVLGPTGQYKNLVDRLGPAHDKAAAILENERRAKLGMEPLGPNYFKDRFVGLISVGGAITENWTSYGLVGMQLMAFPMQMTVVDKYNFYGSMEIGHLARKPELVARFEKMGRNIASAYGTPKNEVKWMGDDQGVCPVCHCNQLTVGRTREVECPLCGIKGTISIQGEELRVDFPEKEQARSRLRIDGIMEHVCEIRDNVGRARAHMESLPANVVPDFMKRFESIPVAKK